MNDVTDKRDVLIDKLTRENEILREGLEYYATYSDTPDGVNPAVEALQKANEIRGKP